MTVNEFKEKNPHLAHLEGNELWDVMERSILIPYVPELGDEEMGETHDIGDGFTLTFTKGAERMMEKFFGGTVSNPAPPKIEFIMLDVTDPKTVLPLEGEVFKDRPCE